MRYSVLLTGRNKVVIEDFFSHLGMEYECLTCSGRFEDLKNHLKYITPDAVIFCLLEDDQSSMQQLITLRDVMQRSRIPLIIIGTKEDCNTFVRYAPGVADLVVEKPLPSAAISERISHFLTERKIAQEKSKAVQEEMALQEQMAEEEEARKKHILVVDDEPQMLKLIKEYLHEEYDVATAVSGKVAMRFLANRTTDLILLDYEMPEESGPEVLAQLHKNEATKNIPVVFLTGIMDRERIQKALQYKPQGYLLKPIDHDKLAETIRKLLG